MITGAALADPASARAQSGGCDEQVLDVACAGTVSLVGVLALPPPASNLSTLGVVIVVGGPQYRVGSHRQFVQLARALAAAGHPTLRFDVRGMGDSAKAMPSRLPCFEEIGDDIAAAIDALLQACPMLRGAALWGLCDGASATLLYLHERPDPRVKAIVLANPWVRSRVSLARTHVKHYYRRRLVERAFWNKLIHGGVALEALTGLWSNLRSSIGGGHTGGRAGAKVDVNAPYQDRMAAAWADFDGPVLLLSSGLDLTAREFEGVTASQPLWQSALLRRPPQLVLLPEADHTFSSTEAQSAAQTATVTWLSEVAAKYSSTSGERGAT